MKVRELGHISQNLIAAVQKLHRSAQRFGAMSQHRGRSAQVGTSGTGPPKRVVHVRKRIPVRRHRMQG
jgi:hypothetical protein